MAIIDYLRMFTADEGLTLSAAAESDFTLDFGQVAPSTGHDPDRPVAIFTVSTDVTGTLEISLQDSDQETTGFADCATGVSLSAPTAGTQVVIPVPYRHKRYMRAYFGGAPMAGVVKGFITSGVQDNPGFAQAPSIETA